MASSFERFLRRAISSFRPSTGTGLRRKVSSGAHPRRTTPVTGGLSVPYPGDFRGTGSARYEPKPDGRPDSGEIVWTWVPYEEDYSRGKDRPVLLVGSTGSRLLALMLTSKDHGEHSGADHDYLDLGSGPWDTQGRPSEVKLDRILQIDPRDIRREGAVLDAGHFSRVAAALRARYGWR